MSPEVSTTAAATGTIKRLLPWLVAVAFFMQSLDTTILNTAVPTIAHVMNVTPLDMKSVLACYTLSLAVFIPISGWMADRFGTRRVFASAIGLFTVGSLLCGLAVDINMLVACRVIQGMGGAMMVPVGRMTMVRTFPKSELVRAMSFVSIPSLIGPMLGPVIGGLIVHYLHWSLVFLVNLPVGALGLYMVWRFLPDYRQDKSHPLDVVGFILFGAGIALLSYVLEVFGDHRLSDIEIVGLLAISALLLAGYGVNAMHVKQPLLRLELFRLRSFRAAVGGSFSAGSGWAACPSCSPCSTKSGSATRRCSRVSW
jgi:EmrB/QacA subfamily drug resistance transporter